MTTVTATTAKEQFLGLVREAAELGEKYTITRKGKPCAVLMSSEEYEGLLETLEILSDPKLAKEIRQAVKDADAGKGIPFEKAVGRKQRK